MKTILTTLLCLLLISAPAFGRGYPTLETANPIVGQLATGASSAYRVGGFDAVGCYFTLASTPTNAQDETSYDDTPSTEGTFTAGSGYSALDVITLNDGSTVTVDAVTTGNITQFTVDSSTNTTGVSVGQVLTQVSVAPTGGTGFTLTLDTDNVAAGVATIALEGRIGNQPWTTIGTPATATESQTFVPNGTTYVSEFRVNVSAWTSGLVDAYCEWTY